MNRITLTPKKCVYVAKLFPNSNFYEHTSLFTGRYQKADDIYRLFIQFDFYDISKFMSSSMEVDSAVLSLELTRNEIPEIPGTILVYIQRLEEDFNEKSITWNSQPNAFSEVDGTIAVKHSSCGKLEIDITKLVIGWIDGSVSNNGLMVRGEEFFNSLIGFPGINYNDENVCPCLIINFKYTNTDTDGNSFNKLYSIRTEYFKRYLKFGLTEESKKLIDIIKNRKYKGIIVYPSAVYWEPIQRPQQFLREMAQKGYLCFFCNPPTKKLYINEIEDNLFLLNNEDFLLPVLKDKFIIVLCTWLVQLAWADFIPNKFIWYDVLDRIDFFNCYDDDMLKKHKEIVALADILTYSANSLKTYLYNNDGMYLPNAVNKKDFLDNLNLSISEDIREIVKNDKPVIGYFGAIEEWFDHKMVLELAQRNPDWQFILIGKLGKNKQDELTRDNIHCIGPVAYNKLAGYAKYFHVCIIPFKINKITNSVSPIKFFEYAALGKPVVSTPILELTQYKFSWLYFAIDVNAFEKCINICLTENVQKEANINGKEFALKNTWENRIQSFEVKLKSLPKAMLVYSNIINTESVSVMTPTFLDYDGKNFYSGGAERYLCDLHNLFNKLGLRMLIYQYGNYPWVRRYKNMDIVSLSNGIIDARKITHEKIMSFNKIFYHLTQNLTIFNIYSAFFEAFPIKSGLSIGISHGIAWDSPVCSYNNGEEFWQRNKRFIESAKLCDALVSVDSNTANWFQTIDYNLAKKIKVIHNYVDNKEFTPRKDYYYESRDKIVIVYPRRLYEARGLYLLLDSVDYILKKYKNVEFHFVGRGEKKDVDNVKEKIKKWGTRVKWYSPDFEEMSDIYKESDITVIPTLYSEGTSLSCIEAMSCGNAVIATRIGGLTDLIINGYNGIMVEPNSNDVKIAIEELIENSSKLIKLRQNAIEVSKSFSKSVWESKWIKLIDSLIDIDNVKTIKPWKLADIYVDKNTLNNSLIIKLLLIELLCNNYLVYVKTKKNLEFNSFGRLQFINWDEENNIKADLVISEEKYIKKINKDVDIVINKKLVNEFSVKPFEFWNEYLINNK